MSWDPVAAEQELFGASQTPYGQRKKPQWDPAAAEQELFGAPLDSAPAESETFGGPSPSGIVPDMLRTKAKELFDFGLGFAGLRDAAIGGVQDVRSSLAATSALWQQDQPALEQYRTEPSHKTQEQEAFGKELEARKKAGDETVRQAAKNVAGAIWEQPVGALHEGVAQTANMGPILGGMAAGAKLGALAYPPMPPLGAVIGGAAGGLLGAIGVETGGYVKEHAKAGKAFDQEAMDRLKTEGGIKGSVTGAVDYLMLGLNRLLFGIPGTVAKNAALKALSYAGVDVADKAAVEVALKVPSLNRAATEAAEAAFRPYVSGAPGRSIAATTAINETIAEGVGDYGGEWAAGRDPSLTDAVLESVMSGPMSAAELGAASQHAKDARERMIVPVAPKPAEPAPDAARWQAPLDPVTGRPQWNPAAAEREIFGDAASGGPPGPGATGGPGAPGGPGGRGVADWAPVGPGGVGNLYGGPIGGAPGATPYTGEFATHQWDPMAAEREIFGHPAPVGPGPQPVPVAMPPTGPQGGGEQQVARVLDAPKAAQPFMGAIQAAAAKHGIPGDLLAAVADQETGASWRTDLVSPKGAAGLMQFMPGTARRFGIDPNDPAQAIDGAARYLRVLYDEFGDWNQALAGYNAGEGAVRKHGGIPPFKETQGYVAGVQRRRSKFSGYADPEGLRPGIDFNRATGEIGVYDRPAFEQDTYADIDSEGRNWLHDLMAEAEDIGVNLDSLSSWVDELGGNAPYVNLANEIQRRIDEASHAKRQATRFAQPPLLGGGNRPAGQGAGLSQEPQIATAPVPQPAPPHVGRAPDQGLVASAQPPIPASQPQAGPAQPGTGAVAGTGIKVGTGAQATAAPSPATPAVAVSPRLEVAAPSEFAPTRNLTEPRVPKPAESAQGAVGAPVLVRVRDVDGFAHYVRQADLDSAALGKLRTFSRRGAQRGTVLRANLADSNEQMTPEAQFAERLRREGWTVPTRTPRTQATEQRLAAGGYGYWGEQDGRIMPGAGTVWARPPKGWTPPERPVSQPAERAATQPEAPVATATALEAPQQRAPTRNLEHPAGPTPAESAQDAPMAQPQGRDQGPATGVPVGQPEDAPTRGGEDPEVTLTYPSKARAAAAEKAAEARWRAAGAGAGPYSSTLRPSLSNSSRALDGEWDVTAPKRWLEQEPQPGQPRAGEPGLAAGGPGKRRGGRGGGGRGTGDVAEAGSEDRAAAGGKTGGEADQADAAHERPQGRLTQEAEPPTLEWLVPAEIPATLKITLSREADGRTLTKQVNARKAADLAERRVVAIEEALRCLG